MAHPSIRLSPRDILFEDDNYIAVNKHRGWLVHATVDRGRSNLFSALQSFLKKRAHGEEQYLALHHRLDVWTSGVVVFAKCKAANPVLADLFRRRRAKKIYIGVCARRPPTLAGELVHFLDKQRVGGSERMVVVERGGHKAVTRYRDVSGDGTTRVEFELVTGRMHQIRAQAAVAGFPLLGDRLYGEPVDALAGQLLHASRLVFYDPISDCEIGVDAPEPDALVTLTDDNEIEAPGHVAFHKPYGVLCQFTADRARDRTLAEFGLPPGLYPAGRLDKDSEGLVLLTNDGAAKHALLDRKKVYWVQVENVPTDAALAEMARGVRIRDYTTMRCGVRRLEGVSLPARVPPIRRRQNIPTAWIEVTISEGRNRQVRRMTAAIGHPTLRLVRVAVGRHRLNTLASGSWRQLSSLL